MGYEFAYIRVSTTDQNTDRQLADLNLPHERFFVDRSSGKDMNRTELQNLFRAVREGDLVHVHSLDRLARNLKDLLRILDLLTSQGVSVHIHKENIHLAAGSKNNPMTRLILQILGAIAEWERAIILERQAEGIAAARKKGKKFGKPSKVTDDQKTQVLARLEKEPAINFSKLSRETGVPRSTIYEIRKMMKKKNDAASANQKNAEK